MCFSNFFCTLSHIGNSKNTVVCVFVLYASEIKKNNQRCTQCFERCTLFAALLAKHGQGCESPALTNRRKKQKVIVYPFEDDRATVWHRRANNEFSWERNQSETQKSANTDAFHSSQNVHCVPAAFCIYSQKLKYSPLFQMFLLCSSSLTRL